MLPQVALNEVPVASKGRQALPASLKQTVSVALQVRLVPAMTTLASNAILWAVSRGRGEACGVRDCKHELAPSKCQCAQPAHLNILPSAACVALRT